MKGQAQGRSASFQGDSPASLFPLPGSGEAGKTAATSGRKWPELSKSSGQLGLLEKMLLESSRWHSPIFYLSWKPVDIGQGHSLYRLAVSGPGTGVTGWQLWATPNTMDYLPQRSPEALQRQAKGSRKGRKRPANLREQVDPETVARWEETYMMYNTPTAQDAKNSTMPRSQQGRDSLVGDIMREMSAAPRAAGWQTGQASRADMGQGKGGQLNPEWVEWLMGFPAGWTDTGT